MMARKMDTGKSLQELDGQDWGEPSYPSRLVTECHRLRRVPLKELSPDDVRLLLGQRIGQAYLVPLALDYLTADPFVSGRHYPGDLLEMLLMVPNSFWHDHPELRQSAVSIANRALLQFQDQEADMSGPVYDSLEQRVRQFLSSHSSLS
jgi:hypothetical protein